MILGRWIVSVALVALITLTIVRVFGLDAGFPLVALMTVYPYVVVTTGLTLVVASLLRLPAASIAAGVTVVIGLILLSPRVLPAPDVGSDEGGVPLTIAVLNLAEGRADAIAVVDAIIAAPVDVFVALEVTDASVDALDDAGLGDVLPHAEVRPSRLTSGGAIWSRDELEAREPSPLRGFGATPRATIDVPGHGPVAVDAVHPLPPISPDWTRAWHRVLRALPDPSPDDAPRRILAGDFNATLDHRALRDVLDRGWIDAAAARGAGLRPTFNGRQTGEPVPPVTLDHVLVDNEVGVVDVTTQPIAGSDHHLLVVSLRLPPS